MKTNTRQRVLIVGGYGKVGRLIAKQLNDECPDIEVVIAGRSITKAVKTILNHNLRAQAVTFNASQPYVEVIISARMVIACVEEPNLAKVCLENGVHYIDISADYSHLLAIKNWQNLAEQNQAVAVLCVGLAPGLSTLMANYVYDQIVSPTSVDTYVLLGAGEKHGKAAIDWTLKNIGASRKTKPATITFDFPSPLYRRKLMWLNFADQFFLSESLNDTLFRSWFGLDSGIMNATLRWFGRLFLNPRLRSWLVWLSGLLHFGSDRFMIISEAKSKTESNQISVQGRGEATATAYVAAVVTKLLINRQHDGGVYLINEILNFEDIWDSIPNTFELKWTKQAL